MTVGWVGLEPTGLNLGRAEGENSLRCLQVLDKMSLPRVPFRAVWEIFLGKLVYSLWPFSTSVASCTGMRSQSCINGRAAVSHEGKARAKVGRQLHVGSYFVDHRLVNLAADTTR